MADEGGGGPAAAAVTWIENAVLGVAETIARRWLLTVNLVMVVFVSLPLLAPLLMANGQPVQAATIYAAYRLLCHQQPYRTFFVGGRQIVYSREEIEALTEARPLADFTGSAASGYKMAYCERDTATYAAILLLGLFAALARPRLARLPLRLYLALLAPMALDGLTQLAGLRESTWLLRTLTGALFGIASVWLLYPELDDAMRQAAHGFAARRNKRDALSA